MRVAIVGGGFLGAAVARALDGPVWVGTRSGIWREGDCPSHVEMAQIDLCARPLHKLPPRSCDALLIAVAPGSGGAKSDRSSGGAAGSDARHALYVQGVRALLKATGAHDFGRIVFTGSTSALPGTDGWVFEDTPLWPTTERGRVQREAEGVVAEHGQRTGAPWTVLRLAGLYGPGRPLGRVYKKRSDAPLPGNGNTPTNLIHRDDAVAACLAALRAPAHSSGIVHVCDDDHCTRREMYAAVAAKHGLDPVQWAEPVGATEAPVGKRVSNLKMKSELGVRLYHPTHR